MKTLFLLFVASILVADVPQLAKLDKIYSNGVQKFSIGIYSFTCQPYGVVTLDELLADKASLQRCKERLQNYFLQEPTQNYFTQMHMHSRQNYHIRFKQNRCIIYARGEKTLSELLLEQGLAIMKQNFQDDEFRYLFYTAQKRAEIKKLGLWSDSEMKKCVSGRSE